MYPIKQSTAITVPFYVHDANGDAVTGLTDGSFTKRISKGSAAFGAMTVTITEMENGWYSIPLSTSHSDTLDILTILFTNAGAKQVNLQFRVTAKLIDNLNDLGGVAQTADNNTILATLPTQTYLDGRTLASASYFDPATDTVANVTLCATTTTNTDMRGTDSAATAANLAIVDANIDAILVDTGTSIPAGITVLDAKIDAVKIDTAAILIDTNELQADWANGGRLDLILDARMAEASYTAPDNAGITQTQADIAALNDLSFADVWTGTLTESYAANTAALTPAQAFHMIWADLRSPKQTGTTWSDYRLDNTTVTMTFTLDDATTPTSKTRAT